MATFRKQLPVGEYDSLDGPVKVTTERLHHWSGQLAAMQAKGLAVVGDWGHGDPADENSWQPKPLAQAGGSPVRLSAIVVAPDGQSADVVVDIDDPKAIEAARANAIQLSPVIAPHLGDVITRIDLVDRGAWNTQGAFVPVRMGAKSKVIRMALGDSPMEEDDKPKDDAESPIEEASESPPVEEVPPVPEIDPTIVQVSRIIGLLKGRGLPMPDDTDLGAFLSNLEAAFAPQSEPAAPTAPAADQPKVAQPGVSMMAAGDNPWKAIAERQHRAEVERRLRGVRDSGRCTPDDYAKRKAALGVVRMSLAPTGQIEPTDVEKWIADRETLPAFCVVPKANKQAVTRMAADGVQEPPEGAIEGGQPVRDYAKTAAELRARAGFKS